MPPTGVAVMVVLAVGVGAFLYYIFADNQHQYGNEGGYSPPPRENPNSWANSHNDSKPRRRKRGSSVGTGKSSCTICLAELADKESVLLSCKHEFHEACIKKWREQGPSEARNTCPNCREDIIGSSAWN